ncbi:MAG: hypothetical protein ACKO7D_07425 [Bacteroidota bacterium]
MIREERTSFLAGLTFLIYGFIQWIEKGVFFFPFPLNEIVIFLIYFYFFILNKWKVNRINFLLGSAVVFKMLSQQLFWSFFLSNESLEILYEGIWTDVFYLLYAISWIGFTIFYLRTNERSIHYSAIFLLLVPFAIGVFLNQPIFEILSFSILIGIAWYHKIDRINLSLIGLICFLEVGKLVMLL